MPNYERKIETVGGRFTEIRATDKPGRFSRAQHRYSVRALDGSEVCGVKFQKGKASRGVNGAALQDVVAVALDRAQQLQQGGYASRKVALAAGKLEEALLLLQARK